MGKEAKIKDIPSEEVSKYIESYMSSTDDTKKKLKPLLKKMKEQDLLFKKDVKKVHKSLQKEKKKSIKKSVTNTKKDEHFLQKLKTDIKDSSIPLSLRKKLHAKLKSNDEYIRSQKIDKLQQKYSLKNQNCDQRKFYNCQKGYNSCKFSVTKMKCQFDSQLQQELIKAIVDECQDECVCTRQRPYKNYYRGRNYCSDESEKITVLESLSSMTRFSTDLMPLGLSTIYHWTLQSVLNLDRRYYEDNTVFFFIHSAVIPNLINLIRASKNLMYEIDNQGFKKVFKKYFKVIGISSLMGLPNITLNYIISWVCHKLIHGTELNYKLSNFRPDEEGIGVNFNITKSKRISDWTIQTIESLGVAFVGAAEETLFRETLPKLLQKIKPYLYSFYEKEFHAIQDRELDYQVKQTTYILITSITGIYFGLMHISNGSLDRTICQIIYCIIGGVFYSYMKKKMGLISCWTVHFTNNFLATKFFSN